MCRWKKQVNDGTKIVFVLLAFALVLAYAEILCAFTEISRAGSEPLPCDIHTLLFPRHKIFTSFGSNNT